MAERIVHTIQRAQPDLMGRAALYLEHAGDQGFDRNDRDQIVGATFGAERDITGVIALRFPPGDERMLEIAHFRTEAEHAHLIDWAARNARMLGRPLLHVVSNQRDIAVFTEHKFVQNGSIHSLVRTVEI